MNHKEIVRQISELDDEDFLLLECAVSRQPDQVNSSHKQSTATSDPDSCNGMLRVPSHIGLREEDMEDMSVTEQLECLLERLRMDGRGRVSTDSGAISDMESLSGTAVEEELEGKQHRQGDGEMKSESKCVYSHPLNDTSSETMSIRESRTEHCDRASDVSGLEVCQLEKSASCVNKQTERVTNSQQQQQTRHRVTTTKRKIVSGVGGREREFRGVGNTTSRQRPSVKHPPLKESLTQTARSVTEKTSKIPRVELIEHPPHYKDAGPSEFRHRNRQSFHHPPSQQEKEQDMLCEIEEDNESSPTEGGPFITHWGKGRWKRNNINGGGGSNGASNNSRDYNHKRHYNNTSQQFTSQSRQQFVGPHGERGGGYRQRSRDFSNRYSTRFDGHNRDSSFYNGGYKNTSSFVRNRGKETQQQQHHGGSKTPNAFERHKVPPSQSSREEQASSREAQASVPNEATSHVMIPDNSLSSTTLVTDPPVPATTVVVAAEKQPVKLSYARVTSSFSNTSGVNRSLKTSVIPSTKVVPCQNNNNQNTPHTIIKPQSNSTDQSVSLSTSQRDKCSSISPDKQDRKTIPTQPEIIDHSIESLTGTPTEPAIPTTPEIIHKTTDTSVIPTKPEITTDTPAFPTKPEITTDTPAIPTKPELLEHEISSHTQKSSENTMDKTISLPSHNNKPENNTATLVIEEHTHQDTPVTDTDESYHHHHHEGEDSGGTKYEIIAASFNYREIVDFLHQGEMHAYTVHVYNNTSCVIYTVGCAVQTNYLICPGYSKNSFSV